MKKVNKDPFSNGTEHMIFETYNCDRCIKSTWDGVAIKGDFQMLSWEDEEPLCVEITLSIKGDKKQIKLEL